MKIPKAASTSGERASGKATQTRLLLSQRENQERYSASCLFFRFPSAVEAVYAVRMYRPTVGVPRWKSIGLHPIRLIRAQHRDEKPLAVSPAYISPSTGKMLAKSVFLDFDADPGGASSSALYDVIRSFGWNPSYVCSTAGKPKFHICVHLSRGHSTQWLRDHFAPLAALHNANGGRIDLFPAIGGKLAIRLFLCPKLCEWQEEQRPGEWLARGDYAQDPAADTPCMQALRAHLSKNGVMTKEKRTPVKLHTGKVSSDIDLSKYLGGPGSRNAGTGELVRDMILSGYTDGDTLATSLALLARYQEVTGSKGCTSAQQEKSTMAFIRYWRSAQAERKPGKWHNLLRSIAERNYRLDFKGLLLAFKAEAAVMGETTFMLTDRMVADYLGFSRQRGGDLLRAAIKKGELKLLAPGRDQATGKPKQGLANIYSVTN